MLTSAQGLIRQAKSAMPASQLKVYILSSVPRDGDDDDGGDGDTSICQGYSTHIVSLS